MAVLPLFDTGFCIKLQTLTITRLSSRISVLFTVTLKDARTKF